MQIIAKVGKIGKEKKQTGEMIKRVVVGLISNEIESLYNALFLRLSGF